MPEHLVRDDRVELSIEPISADVEVRVFGRRAGVEPEILPVVARPGVAPHMSKGTASTRSRSASLASGGVIDLSARAWERVR